MQAVDGHPSVVFVDMASGSCLFAVLKRLRSHAGREGRHRSESGDAGGFRVPSVALAGGSRRARRGGGRQGHRVALMPIVLFRVDDRLVHGQVVIGWGRPLGVERIVLVDDQVVDQPMGAGPLSHGRHARDRRAIRRPSPKRRRACPSGRRHGHRVLVLTGETWTPWPPSTARHRPWCKHINLGGVHHRPGPARAAAVPVPDRRGAARPHRARGEPAPTSAPRTCRRPARRLKGLA